MSVQTYDPKDLAVTVDGRILTGLGEEMIAAERLNPQVESVAGAQGDVARAMTNDKRGSVTIQVLATSPANLILSDIVNDDGVNGSNRIFPLLVKDNRGSDVLGAEDAWIENPPRTVYSKTIEMREWVIQCAQLDMVIGGIPTVA